MLPIISPNVGIVARTLTENQFIPARKFGDRIALAVLECFVELRFFISVATPSVWPAFSV
jgi:hypothetical protein